MREKRDSYAYFWVQGNFATSEITEIMGMSPSKSYEHGEPRKSCPGKTWDQSSWQLHSPLPRDEEFIVSHISALLRVLSQKADVIEKLNSIYDIGINCVGYYTNSNPGFHMDVELVKMLAALQISVDFDLYCYCDHEDIEDTV